jgi:hypothetical protein
MKTTLQPFALFSAERSNKTFAENTDNTCAVACELVHRDIPFKVVIGCYKGVKELTFLVHGDNYQVAYELAKRYEQESILVVDENRNATLGYLDGRPDERYKWAEASPNNLGDAYTLDPETGIYWKCI